MPEPAFRYDEIPYEGHAYDGSHPNRLAAMATLFGMDPPDPARARVLEIGCAFGNNLIPMAYTLPRAELFGIDLSGHQIAQGQEVVRSLGLEGRVTLQQLDLMALDRSFGAFDYIVCHGTWSWVSDEARTHIFRVCRELLAEHGVAYVSYNTHPGWRMRGMIRDVMLYHVAGFDDPRAKLGQARALLDFLAEASPADAPHGLLLRQEVELLSKLNDDYLFHDHLSDMNEPVYFHEFVDQARGAGLQYLGEPHLVTMVPPNLPASWREALDKVSGGDLVRREQFLDFVKNRSFRQTLLVHEEQPLERRLTWRPMTRMHFASQGRVVQEPGEGATQLVIAWEDDEQLTTDDPLVVQALLALLRAWPRFVAFDDLLDRAREAAGSARSREEDRVDLGANLLTCYANAAVEIGVVDLPVAGESDRPRAFPFARHQVETGARWATSLRHVSGTMDPVAREVVRWADGTRDHESLRDRLVEAALDGRLPVLDEKTQARVTDPERLRPTLEEVLARSLDVLARNSFLMAAE